MDTILNDSKTLTPSDYAEYFRLGVDNAQYLIDFENDISKGDAVEHHEYLAQNWQRTKRIYKTTQLSESLLASVAQLSKPINWLIITEAWCGDSSQILSVLVRLAEASQGKINYKIVYRDKHIALIDAHLTNNGRAIPKLLMLDEDFNLLNTWGPRPSEAQTLVIELKKNPETAASYSEHLHKWYAYDKQKAILDELEGLLSI